MTPLAVPSYDRQVHDATTAVQKLEGVGYRVTPSRRAVVDAITRALVPFTVEEICGSVPRVGRATVFRTVKLLHELDVVCRVPLEDGSVRYAMSGSGHHHHLVCRSCGRVEEFSDVDLDRLISARAGDRQFALEGHSLELYGRCGVCRARAVDGGV